MSPLSPLSPLSPASGSKVPPLRLGGEADTGAEGAEGAAGSASRLSRAASEAGTRSAGRSCSRATSIAKGATDDRRMLQGGKKTGTPAPGDYVWDNNVNLKKKPVWSLSSPDRSHVDLMLPTWTPLPTSLQNRAPGPGEYGDLKTHGKNGKFFAPNWSWERNSMRACLAADPNPQTEIALQIPETLGNRHGRHPSRSMPPRWSLTTKDRSQLPSDIPTWTPKFNVDMKPGPGAYESPVQLARRSRYKAVTRRGCTWGGRPQNAHPELRSWVPLTTGADLRGGEHRRYRPKTIADSPNRRCSCVVCPGPGRCDHTL